MKSGIYKIQSKCKPERIYIGSASNIAMRWNAHLHYLRKHKHQNPKLQRHYQKYGEADLQFSILLGCEKKDLLNIEQYFIDSYNPYFNCSKIAGSRLGMKSSDETKERNRIASTGNKYSVGIKHTPEFCKKSSENRKKNWQDPVYQKKVSDGLKRYHAAAGKNNPNIIGLRKAASMSHTPEANAKRSMHQKETLRLKKLNKIA